MQQKTIHPPSAKWISITAYTFVNIHRYIKLQCNEQYTYNMLHAHTFYLAYSRLSIYILHKFILHSLSNHWLLYRVSYSYCHQTLNLTAPISNSSPYRNTCTKNLTGIPPSWKHLPYIQQQQQKFLWNLRGKKKECQNRNIHVLHIYKFFIQTQSILSTYLLELHNETYIRYNISHKFRQLEDFSTTIASITSAQLEKTFNTFSLSILPSPHKRYILVCIILLQCKIDFLSHRDSKE